MSDNPHVQYANAQLRHKKQKSQGFNSDAKHAEREMIRISNLHKIKTGKHINDHAEKLVAHHEKAKEIKRQYVQHSTDLIHAKKAGDKERMERAAKGKAQAEKDHLAHTGEPAEEKFVEYKRPIKEGKQMKTFKELYEACCAACEKRADIEEVKEPTGDLKKACWKGYTAIGMKMKNGRKVPNCVPANEEVEQTDEQAPVAPTLDRKYLKGTPEHKAYKASKVRQKYRLAYKDGKVSVKEDAEQVDEEKDPMVSNWKSGVSRRIKRASSEHQTKLNAHLQKAKSASDFERIHQKLDKLGVREEVEQIDEAVFQGKKVPLNKPMAGDVKKSKVYVDPDGDGTAQKVNFGDKNMTIKKHIPGRRKNFRARHNCDNPGPKTKARYWSCRAW